VQHTADIFTITTQNGVDAERADLDRSFMYGVERGVENPTLFTVQAIAVGELMKGL